jgi:hypothetical protein
MSMNYCQVIIIPNRERAVWYRILSILAINKLFSGNIADFLWIILIIFGTN